MIKCNDTTSPPLQKILHKITDALLRILQYVMTVFHVSLFKTFVLLFDGTENVCRVIHLVLLIISLEVA